jgi:hypothetical protein
MILSHVKKICKMLLGKKKEKIALHHFVLSVCTGNSLMLLFVRIEHAIGVFFCVQCTLLQINFFVLSSEKPFISSAQGN